MIKEDYVSFEVAKLLKEKGFNEECRAYWDSRIDDLPKEYEIIRFTEEPIYQPYDNMHSIRKRCLAPTLQMAMKWLRNEHNILLFLLPAQENGKLVYLVEVWTWNEEEGIYESTYAPMPRKEPEQAIGSALKYSLENLI